MPRIPRSLRKQIILAAGDRCEYCLAPQFLTFATFHVDHIIPLSAGGKTIFENLCLSCPFCNLFKQGRVRARDPRTGKLVRLFNPRLESWKDHFRWRDDGVEITGLTPRGRATVEALRMNNAIALTARRFWASGGVHPPED
jgi:hypothetical protein